MLFSELPKASLVFKKTERKIKGKSFNKICDADIPLFYVYTQHYHNTIPIQSPPIHNALGYLGSYASTK